MAIAIPICIKERLVGTGFIAGAKDETLIVVTTLHLLGNGYEFRVGLPPHLGDLSIPQKYPLQAISAFEAKLVLTEPMFDIAILTVKNSGIRAPIPRFISSHTEVQVGDEVLVVGYPFAAIGSFLETVEPCHVSAVGNRFLGTNINRYEYIITHQTHPGSSGSPVIRKSDGAVCGIVRGCLAPPGIVSIGNLPLGTDTNVTYATSAHIIPYLIADALKVEL